MSNNRKNIIEFWTLSMTLTLYISVQGAGLHPGSHFPQPFSQCIRADLSCFTGDIGGEALKTAAANKLGKVTLRTDDLGSGLPPGATAPADGDPLHALAFDEDYARSKMNKEFNVARFIKKHIKHQVWKHFAEVKVEYSVGELLALVARVEAVFRGQPVFVETRSPITIIGDIHGQYTDLMRIFEAVGWPHQQRMLFLGDYVDRGPNNLECVALLLAYKLLYPQQCEKHQFKWVVCGSQIWLLRGNHEWIKVNMVYGFLEELYRKFERRDAVVLFRKFNACFDWMPLSGLVEGRILCMHGGISPAITGFDALRNLQRPIPSPTALALDLLWSDPDPSGDVHKFGPNKVRMISYCFGPQAVASVCERLDIDLIVRGHQVVQDGYEFHHNKRLVTVFSAPKYCGEFDNTAGICHVAEDLTVSFTLLKPMLMRKSVYYS